MIRQIQPTIITIFGAMGDLSTQKLIPSLFDLYQKRYLPEKFKLIGFSRREVSDGDYRVFAENAIRAKKDSLNEGALADFLQHISYTQGVFDNVEDYRRLAQVLKTKEGDFTQCANKLFYLAVPPIYYKDIFENLSASGLMTQCGGEDGWARVLVEKPFGNDIATALELDQTLGKLFKEEQVFRIDHYLAKEVLQDILMFRFSNMLFEPLWNKDYIEKVEIKMLSKSGLEKRGAFYDGVGALRDVGQNHVLQMLAYIAMEDPVEFEDTRVHKTRTEVLKSLRPITKDNIRELVLRAQYNEYREISTVSDDSNTETYFQVKAFVDNARWDGVPFCLESGQALAEDKTEIKIYFKKTTTCLCPPGVEHFHQNILTFRIQPNESISVLFWAKKPGLTLELEPKDMSFFHRTSQTAHQLTDAYEKVLFDGIAGDQMLFTSTDEVLAEWKFISPILENWKDIPLHHYPKGSNGPAEASLF